MNVSAQVLDNLILLFMQEHQATYGEKSNVLQEYQIIFDPYNLDYFSKEYQMIWDSDEFDTWLKTKFNCTYNFSTNIISFDSEEDSVRFSLIMC